MRVTFGRIDSTFILCLNTWAVDLEQPLLVLIDVFLQITRDITVFA
jgi:hypothetical protein